MVLINDSSVFRLYFVLRVNSCAIIFRGGVKRITDDENLAYYPFKNAPEWILAFVWDGGKKL